MKSSVLLISILVLSLTGCGSRVVKESKETVIERPVASQQNREIIVQKEVSPPRSCVYRSNTYSSNSMTCQDGFQFQCIDGTWNGRNLTC